jgi:hypothetical protein
MEGSLFAVITNAVKSIEWRFSWSTRAIAGIADIARHRRDRALTQILCVLCEQRYV